MTCGPKKSRTWRRDPVIPMAWTVKPNRPLSPRWLASPAWRRRKDRAEVGKAPTAVVAVHKAPRHPRRTWRTCPSEAPSAQHRSHTLTPDSEGVYAAPLSAGGGLHRREPARRGFQPTAGRPDRERSLFVRG